MIHNICNKRTAHP